MSQVVYDLTEVFAASSGGKFSYYGIVRVVQEIACGLYQCDPDLRFAIFSYGENCFYEVHPSIDPETGKVSLNVPKGIKQIHHLRRRFYDHHRLRDALVPIAHKVIDRINQKHWRKANLQLTRLDMNGKTLVATGRPKLMVPALDALDAQGVDYRFIPLLHDVFALHVETEARPARFGVNFVGDSSHVIRHAARIIANSEFTKTDIEKFSKEGFLPPLPETVAVPLAHECPDGTEPPALEIPKDPFLLTVGSTLGRKNLEVVFDAMHLLQEAGGFVPRLVLAGAHRKRVAKYLSQTRYDRIRPYIDMVHSPSQTDLVRLYKSAFAFVIPSRLEGWGLPAGEALWNGTPAICSTAPVLREVCGDLGLYFDPDKPAELAGIITRLHEDREFQENLRSRIANGAAGLRSWADVARDIKHVYDTVLAVKTRSGSFGS